MLTYNPSTLQRATVCAAIAAVAAFSAPSFAAAADADSASRVTIKYVDLDLSKDKDAATLYRRLQTASRAVCRSLRGPELASLQRYKECYGRALADAVNTVNVGTLTALHRRPADKSV